MRIKVCLGSIIDYGIAFGDMFGLEWEILGGHLMTLRLAGPRKLSFEGDFVGEIDVGVRASIM
jgi:hypothetical protein